MTIEEAIKQLKEIKDTIEYDTTPDDMVEMIDELIEEMSK